MYGIFTFGGLGFPIRSALFSNCHLSIVIRGYWVCSKTAV